MKVNKYSEFQDLEPRQLMAVTPLASTTLAFGYGTQLRITGTTGNDVISLSFDGTKYNLSTGTKYVKSFSGEFNSIRIIGGKGNDSITVDTSVTIPAYLHGDDGNDSLRGGSGNDFLYGGAGNDKIFGNDGRDTFITLGGGTSDVATGGAGSDWFWIDNNATEKILDVESSETSTRAVNRVSGFETSKFVTGTKTQAITKELTAQRFRDPDVSNKAYVYKKFENKPLFATEGPTADDVQQGQIGNCYFLATLAGTADVSPETIRTMMTDLGDGTYAVRFQNAAGATKFYRVDNDIAVYNKTSNTPAYAKLGNENSMWVAIAEKTYAFHRKLQGTYNSINGGWMSEAFTTLGATNQQNKWRDQAGGVDAFLSWVEDQLAAGNVVTMAVLNYDGPLNLVSGHAYTVARVETLEDGTKQLVIRNPWGMDGYRTDDASNDGYVTLSAADAHAGINAFVSAKAA